MLTRPRSSFRGGNQASLKGNGGEVPHSLAGQEGHSHPPADSGRASGQRRPRGHHQAGAPFFLWPAKKTPAPLPGAGSLGERAAGGGRRWRDEPRNAGPSANAPGWCARPARHIATAIRPPLLCLGTAMRPLGDYCPPSGRRRRAAPTAQSAGDVSRPRLGLGHRPRIFSLPGHRPPPHAPPVPRCTAASKPTTSAPQAAWLVLFWARPRSLTVKEIAADIDKYQLYDLSGCDHPEHTVCREPRSGDKRKEQGTRQRGIGGAAIFLFFRSHLLLTRGAADHCGHLAERRRLHPHVSRPIHGRVRTRHCQGPPALSFEVAVDGPRHRAN